MNIATVKQENTLLVKITSLIIAPFIVSLVIGIVELEKRNTIKSILEIHEHVVARTQEVPGQSGRLRTSTSFVGTEVSCVTIIELYQAKNSFYYREHPVFWDKPDQIRIVPCLSPK